MKAAGDRLADLVEEMANTDLILDHNHDADDTALADCFRCGALAAVADWRESTSGTTPTHRDDPEADDGFDPERAYRAGLIEGGMTPVQADAHLADRAAHENADFGRRRHAVIPLGGSPDCDPKSFDPASGDCGDCGRAFESTEDAETHYAGRL